MSSFPRLRSFAHRVRDVLSGLLLLAFFFVAYVVGSAGLFVIYVGLFFLGLFVVPPFLTWWVFREMRVRDDPTGQARLARPNPLDQLFSPSPDELR